MTPTNAKTASKRYGVVSDRRGGWRDCSCAMNAETLGWNTERRFPTAAWQDAMKRQADWVWTLNIETDTPRVWRLLGGGLFDE